MLVLTRRAGETIVIGGAVRVTVVAVKGGRVRLGVTAPLSVCVDRSEVHERRPAPCLASPTPSPPSEGE
jgi:carbon storage regulator